jgi:hypothetical protein
LIELHLRIARRNREQIVIDRRATQWSVTICTGAKSRVDVLENSADREHRPVAVIVRVVSGSNHESVARKVF